MVICVCFLMGGNLLAADIDPPNRGCFQDASGQKYWYETKCERAKHFCSLEQKVCIHSLDQEALMPNDIVSKRMIANVVTGFYVGLVFQQDVKFQTDPSDWKPATAFQEKGFCIVAANYLIPKVWIDFVLSPDQKYITKVIHTSGL